MRILSIDGGGYLGLATAAFLRELESFYGKSCNSQFDLFCGTSTGSIIALGLALGMPAREIAEFYRNMGPSIFPARGWFSRNLSIVRVTRDLLFSAYAIEPLQKALEGAFNGATLGQLKENKKFALVTAYSVTKGYPRIFKTDHAPQFNRDDNFRLSDVATASAAAPTYFPLVKLRDPRTGTEELYCDGGIVANHPALLGFAEALDAFVAKPGEVSLMSISTPRMNLAEGELLGANRGLYGWKDLLPSMMIDSNSNIAHELLKRLVKSYEDPKPIYERVYLHNPTNIPIDRVNPGTTQALEAIGSKEASSSETRERLKKFFS